MRTIADEWSFLGALRGLFDHNASKVVQRYPLFNQFLIDTVSILVWYYFDNLLLLRRVSAKMDTITTSRLLMFAIFLFLLHLASLWTLPSLWRLTFAFRFSFLVSSPVSALPCTLPIDPFLSLSFEHCSFSSGLATSYPCSLLAALSYGTDSRRGSE